MNFDNVGQSKYKIIGRANRFLSTVLRCLAVTIFISASIFRTDMAAAEAVQDKYSSVELISEFTTIQPGGKLSLGLILKPKDTWHTYWTNPGDAGKSIQISWDNAAGVVIGPMQFPAPNIVPFMGLVSYGYDEDILVIFDAEIPNSYQNGEVVHLQGAANWLVCDDELCVPQSADISLDIPVSSVNEHEGVNQEFAVARTKVPVRMDWTATYGPYGEENVLFHVETPAAIKRDGEIALFPGARRTIDHASLRPVGISASGSGFLAKATPQLIKTPQSDLVLTVKGDSGKMQSYIVSAELGDLSQIVVVEQENLSSSGGEVALVDSSKKGTFVQLIAAIGLAVFGGLLLNLMPCVLPILSLKALSLVKLSGEGLKTARKNGLVYTAGILSSFLLFALVLSALRGAGSYAGWGFQMQHPVVLVVLVLFIGAIGANLAGLFEFGSSLSNVGQGITQGSGFKAEFFTGVLAVVVASPCTAPFMGGALGYALTQPITTTILIFLGLGMGLAMPYLLLCYFPAARAWIPKPGAWMHSFKQLLAFPMFATAIWLLWVLGNQVGLQYVLGVLVLALLLSMAMWAKGKAGQSPKKIIWNVFAALILGGAVWAAVSLPDLKENPQDKIATRKLNAEPYSLERLESLLADDQAVFAYFTADWCITCKVNEKSALYKPEVAAAFAGKNIHVLVGDWTNPDDDIAKILKRFDRVGVPLYLYYTPGTALDDAKILPQILSTKTIINAL